VTEEAYPAMLWESLEDGKVLCRLCPWRCKIAEDKLGRCCVRKNIGGKLHSMNYYRLCATNVDPIEKKPLFHFLPGTMSFSIACVGCNFQCDFCQNWQIAQMPRNTGQIAGQKVSPQTIVRQALDTGCKSISYTYTEPTIFYELAYETSKLAHEAGLKNTFVSNGYITTEALETIEPYLDGINVDLKSFREDFYKRMCHAHLEPVLTSLRWLAKSRVWLEITTLLIPGQNDSDDELKEAANFIAAELGPHIPWHISRYHPDYKYADSGPTPLAAIERALEIGKQAGLRYCYGGNAMGHPSESTYCYNCGKLLIGRIGFTLGEYEIRDGRCPSCQAQIDGVWI